MGEILFLSHNIRHQRCFYLIKNIERAHCVLLPRSAVDFSSRLSLSRRSISNMFHLGLSALRYSGPIHLDGIDVFIHPFLRGAQFLHDYHVPLVQELKWLGYDSLALIAQTLIPASLAHAKVVISPNKKMIRLAAQYTKLRDCYVIPNYPPKSFYIQMRQEEARTRLEIPRDKRITLFVGGARIREIYGIELLIRTWFQVKRRMPESLLYVIGPSQQLGFDNATLSYLGTRGIVFVGQVRHTDVPMWIAAADLCVSQRTPGFPSEFYDIHDSIKLSEYALFDKPIVAAGYLPGKDYIHAETNVDSYSRAILSGLKGEAPKPTPHTWEENLPTIRKAYSALMDG